MAQTPGRRQEKNALNQCRCRWACEGLRQNAAEPEKRLTQYGTQWDEIGAKAL
jgi:hypothetical protein